MTRAALVLALAGCEAVFGYDDQRWHESAAATCQDHIDNDGDGLVDCDDPDCAMWCHRDPTTCGNGQLESGEACDTGIAPGAMGACPTDCDDRNTCTNDRLAAAGTCFASCAHETIASCCGNGILEAGESCDDGNQDDFDGCTHDCRFERALVLDAMSVLPGYDGCDLTGDGDPDNAFGGAMNDQARNYVSRLLVSHLQSCPQVSLFRLVTPDSLIEDATELNLLVGQDAVDPPNLSDYFSGTHSFLITSENLNADGLPAQTLPFFATATMVWTQTTGSTRFPLAYCPLTYLDVYHFQMAGSLGNDGGIPRFSVRACGAVSISSMHRWPNQTGFGGGSLLDMAVVGLLQLAYRIDPTQPDIDIDGDGLEALSDTDGDGLVDLCIDGNGTQLTGTNCPEDPRIADGYSVATGMDAIGALLAGRAP